MHTLPAISTPVSTRPGKHDCTVSKLSTVSGAVGEPCTCLVPMRRSEWHRVCIYALCFSLSTFHLSRLGGVGATQPPFPAYWRSLVTLRPERDDGDGDGDGHKRARSQHWLHTGFLQNPDFGSSREAWTDSSLSAITSRLSLRKRYGGGDQAPSTASSSLSQYTELGQHPTPRWWWEQFLMHPDRFISVNQAQKANPPA